MRFFKKIIYNNDGQETGAIIRVELDHPINPQQKLVIENKIINYCHDVLYRGEGFNIFRDAYEDNPSVIVIKNIDNLPNIEIAIQE